MARGDDHGGEGRYVDLSATTPCCGASTTLNDLDYGRPGLRFGRFTIEILNPGEADSSPEQDAAMAKAVGAPLGKVWMHL